MSSSCAQAWRSARQVRAYCHARTRPNLTPVGALAEVHEQVAGLLGDPVAGGVSGDLGEVDLAAVVLDHEENAEAVQEDGVDVGEVHGEDRVGLRTEELRPGGPGSSWCGIEPGVLQDLPRGRGGHVMAESEQLALDVESAWGAVAGFPRLRFPRPLSEPDVRLSPHPALHRTHAAGSMFSVGQADGIVVPLQR